MDFIYENLSTKKNPCEMQLVPSASLIASQLELKSYIFTECCQNVAASP